MDGYLVLVRCGMDDLPLRLFATENEAIACAAALCTEDAVREAARPMLRLLSIDVSHWVAVFVVRYAGGVPVAADAIVDFDP